MFIDLSKNKIYILLDKYLLGLFYFCFLLMLILNNRFSTFSFSSRVYSNILGIVFYFKSDFLLFNL